MTKNLFKALGFLTCLLSAGLFNNFVSISASPAPDFKKLNPDCFHALPGNPIMTRDSLLLGSDWNDPSVMKVGRHFVMYASSDVNFNYNMSIYRLVSTDMKNWILSPKAPVLNRGKLRTSFDRRAVETPSVVFFQGKYHMFYTGYAKDHADPSGYRIGHAVSVDGIKWVKDPAPILAPKNPTGNPDLSFDQYVVGEPGAVVFRNKIYLYFTALGAAAELGTTLQTIGVMSSADGVQWSQPQLALKPDQGIYPRSQWMGYSTPAPVVLDAKVHLFFDVVQANPWQQLRIHHSSSSDGVTNWVQDGTPLFSSTDFPWTSREIRAPSVLLDKTTLHLLFAGDDGVALGIGYAECSL